MKEKHSVNQTAAKNLGWWKEKDILFLSLIAVVSSLGISFLYFLEILSLPVLFGLISLPFLAWLFYSRPETAFLALVVVYFASVYFFPDVLTQGLLRGLFLLIIGFVLLVKLGLRKAITRIRTPLDSVITLLFFIVLASFVYGFFFRHNSMKYLLGDLYKFMEIILAFWLTTFLVRDRRQIRLFIWGFFLVVILFGVVDSMTFLTRAYSLGGALGARVRAGAQFSSIFALLLAIPFILHERKILIRLIIATLSLGFLISFLISFLRTGYIAIPFTLAFMIVLYFCKSKRYAWVGIVKFAFLAAIVLISAGLLSVAITRISPHIDIIQATMDRFNTLTYSTSVSPWGVRGLEIKSIISQVLFRNPLLGNGLGGEYYGWIHCATTGEITWGIKHYVHNNYFDFVVRTGILGLIIFLVLIFKYVKDAVGFYLRSQERFDAAVILGFIGIFVSSCIMAISTGILYSPLLFIAVALTYSVGYLIEKNR
ncbi:hypothetical protein ES703_59136 [subsurface metagenome]